MSTDDHHETLTSKVLENRKDQLSSSQAIHPINNSSSSSSNSKLSLDTSRKSRLGSFPHIVGIYTAPSVEYIVFVLSVLRCGAAFLPLDHSLPKHRILSILSCVNVDLVVQTCSPSGDVVAYPEETEWLARYGNHKIMLVSMQRLFTENDDYVDLAWPCEDTQQRVFCYVMHTSGSTGKPKCVCGTEKGRNIN